VGFFFSTKILYPALFVLCCSKAKSECDEFLLSVAERSHARVEHCVSTEPGGTELLRKNKKPIEPKKLRRNFINKIVWFVSKKCKRNEIMI
jgi:hypothetical protein